MKSLYITLSIILFSIIAITFIVFLFLSNTKNKIAIEIQPLHPGFTNMQIKDPEAWQELFERIKLSQLNKISYGNILFEIQNPIKKVNLIITDEEQKDFVFAEGATVGSSAQVNMVNDTLEVKMFINEDLVDNIIINNLIHDTFWLIAQNSFPLNEDIYKLSLESKKYLHKHNLQLIELR